MKNLFLICCALLSFLVIGLIPAVAQTPAIAWAKQPTTGTVGASYNYGRAIATDAVGNSYVTGRFVDIIGFGGITLNDHGGSGNIFTVKYNASGTAVWAVKAGGLSTDEPYGIAVDASGNSYVTGTFKGTATFGSTTLHSSGVSEDIFTVKYDSSGTVVWAVKGGGPGYDHGQAIAVDANGNNYITGFFEGTATFGTASLTSTIGGDDIFIVKYNASGAVVWAKKVGGVSDDAGTGIAVDGSGNCYVTGSVYGSLTFGNTTLPARGGQDVIIIKYDTTGAVVWAERGGGTGSDIGRGIAVDGNGNSYVTGEFNGTATFGSTTLAGSGMSDIFTVKYNASGSVVWAVKGGGKGNDHALDIAVDGSGSSYVTGGFDGTAAFGSNTLPGSGMQDMYMIKYDALGAVIWALNGGGTGMDAGFGVAVDSNGNSYVTGNFEGSATLGTTSFTSSSNRMFIAKIKAATPNGVSTNIGSSPEVKIYPIPNNGLFNLEIKGFGRKKIMLTAYDVTGKNVLSKAVTAVNGTVTENLQLPSQQGIYFLKIVSDNQILTRKIIVE